MTSPFFQYSTDSMKEKKNQCGRLKKIHYSPLLMSLLLSGKEWGLFMI